MERQNKGKTYNGKQGGFSKEKSFGDRGAKPYQDSSRGKSEYKAKPYQDSTRGKSEYQAKPYQDSPRGKSEYQAKPYQDSTRGKSEYKAKPYQDNSRGKGEYKAKPYQDGPRGKSEFTPKPYQDNPRGKSEFRAKPYHESRGEARPYSAKEPSERSYNAKPQREYAGNQQEVEQRDDIVAGRNPVIELLKNETPVDCVYLQKTESKSGAILKIMSMARDKGLVIKEVTKEKLDSMAPGINHQGAVAVVAAYEFATVEEIIARAGDEKLFVVIADEIEDPHNLGAIIRTADAAGAHGVIIPKRRGAGLTSAVMRASAGAASHVAVAKVPNLVQVIDQLKEMGVWIYAADMDGTSWCTVDYNGAVALVVGSEGKGVSRLVKEHCDVVVSLPMQGKINSLNASVAAGIILYEVARQRQGLVRK